MSNSETPTAAEHSGVLPVIAIIAPSLDALGGQSIQADNLATSLKSEGYKIIFVPANPRLPVGLSWVKRIPYLRTLVNEFFYLLSLRVLRIADVVHIFSASYWSFLLQPAPAIMVARLFKKRSVLNYHSGEADDHLQNWGSRVHPWLKKVDEIVVPSPYLQTVFEKYGYQSRVILNIVNTTNFQYRRRQPLQPKLFSNRNLESIYCVDNSLKAFALVKKTNRLASLTIVGTGSEEESLKAWVRESGLEGVEFVGKVSPEDMPAYFDASDIFLNSSVVDNQPVSILEAIAAGCPIVSTPTGDIPAMVDDGVSGCLVPHGDPEAMAGAIVRLLENDEKAAEMAMKAFGKLENYTWHIQRNKWNQLYRETVL